MRSERERLLDILEAIERIEKYASEGKGAFEADELIQNWMVNHISIIGEACRSLSPEFQARYTNVPWADIIGMRNILLPYISLVKNPKGLACWSGIYEGKTDL